MKRSARARLDAIPNAIAERDRFHGRINLASGDVGKLADLMAEAIEMAAVARRLEVVGRDGRKTICLEEVAWAQAMNEAASAYRAAALVHVHAREAQDVSMREIA